MVCHLNNLMKHETSETYLNKIFTLKITIKKIILIK
jgi:hypothetical protein